MPYLNINFPKSYHNWKSPEKLYIFTNKGKLNVVQATEVRKDEVYRRIVEELSFVNHIISENIESKFQWTTKL
jgi:hypothetical protein